MFEYLKKKTTLTMIDEIKKKKRLTINFIEVVYASEKTYFFENFRGFHTNST